MLPNFLLAMNFSIVYKYNETFLNVLTAPGYQEDWHGRSVIIRTRWIDGHALEFLQIKAPQYLCACGILCGVWTLCTSIWVCRKWLSWWYFIFSCHKIQGFIMESSDEDCPWSCLCSGVRFTLSPNSIYVLFLYSMVFSYTYLNFNSSFWFFSASTDKFWYNMFKI